MTLELEQHLMEMGVIPPTLLGQLESVVDTRHKYLTKGHFNDPRDDNGEVPY